MLVWSEAFNHLTPALLTAAPDTEGGKRVLFLSGDDAEAKASVAALYQPAWIFWH